MNYSELYNKLIQLRKTNKLFKSKDTLGKIESHHILPRCCGGTDDPENIVNLYAKEHFMAHYYLWKIHENDEFKYQTLNAFWMMCTMSSLNQDRTYQEFIQMSEEYQQARIEFAKYISATIPLKISGDKNGQHNMCWIVNFKLKQNAIISKNSPLPNGWQYGRCIDFNAYEIKLKNKLKKQRIYHEKLEKRKKEIEKLPWYYDNFLKYGYVWLIQNYPYTPQAFIRNCKKYLPYYKSQKGRQRIKKNKAAIM